MMKFLKFDLRTIIIRMEQVFLTYMPSFALCQVRAALDYIQNFPALLFYAEFLLTLIRGWDLITIFYVFPEFCYLSSISVYRCQIGTYGILTAILYTRAQSGAVG